MEIYSLLFKQIIYSLRSTPRTYKLVKQINTLYRYILSIYNHPSYRYKRYTCVLSVHVSRWYLCTLPTGILFIPRHYTRRITFHRHNVCIDIFYTNFHTDVILVQRYLSTKHNLCRDTLPTYILSIQTWTGTVWNTLQTYIFFIPTRFLHWYVFT